MRGDKSWPSRISSIPSRRDRSKQRDRLIAVYIGILAVALAICSVGGGNATKDATARNIEAANAWAFFQAKNIRRNDVRLQIDTLELRLATEPESFGPARAPRSRTSSRATAPMRRV